MQTLTSTSINASNQTSVLKSSSSITRVAPFQAKRSSRSARSICPATISASAAGALPLPPAHTHCGKPTKGASASFNAPVRKATGFFGWWRAQQAKTAALRTKLAALGLAAVLAYGMFDGISYTIAFTLAFLGYEARTGLNPTQNVADIIKICILMWAGNNVTRPFRLAGAAALAPFMDKVMDKIQAKLKLKNKAFAFAIVVAAVALPCFAVVGGLFLSRLVF